jgi:hypothetical protein
MRILILCCSTRLLFPYLELSKFIQCVTRGRGCSLIFVEKPASYQCRELAQCRGLEIPSPPAFQGASMLFFSFDTQRFPAPCHFEKIYDGLSLLLPKANWILERLRAA